MISLREFHDVFKSINPWESDAEAFVRTDADGIVYVPSSMIADEEQRQAAYDEMDEEGTWIAFPDASELRLGKDVALRYAERFLSENDYERVVDIFYRRGAFRRFKDLLDERRGILHVRRHLAASPLFKGIPNFKETRIAMLRAETVKELFSILDYIRGNYGMNC